METFVFFLRFDETQSLVLLATDTPESPFNPQI